VYQYYFSYAEQYTVITPSLIQDVLIALACMIGVALIMIPSIACAGIIALAIVSVDVGNCFIFILRSLLYNSQTGVTGFMCFWSVNVDAISMISLVMSTGFAIDLTAHIT
jgi:hypothetical protein